MLKLKNSQPRFSVKRNSDLSEPCVRVHNPDIKLLSLFPQKVGDKNHDHALTATSVLTSLKRTL